MLTFGQRRWARNILNAVSGVDPLTTTFRVEVEKDLIIVRALGGLDAVARQLIREHKELLIEYLTTPPSINGQCRRGHEIEWRVSPQGIWLCACYWAGNVAISSDAKVVQFPFLNKGA